MDSPACQRYHHHRFVNNSSYPAGSVMPANREHSTTPETVMCPGNIIVQTAAAAGSPHEPSFVSLWHADYYKKSGSWVHCANVSGKSLPSGARPTIGQSAAVFKKISQVLSGAASSLLANDHDA
jgi:hypothetical protein